MLLHHIVVFGCFGIAAHTKVYVPYAVISLIIEVNSMCLHGRALLLLTGWSKQSPLFRVVAVLNLVTYIFFRICVLGWMTRWLTLHRDDLPLVMFTIGSVGLATIVAINIVNFYRVLMSDFLKVVGEGAIENTTRKHKISESNDESTKDEVHMNGSAGTLMTSAATDALVEKIRDIAYFAKDPCKEGKNGLNGFHPISKDVNKIMNSFFSNEVMEDFESVGEQGDSHENIPRHRKQVSVKEKEDAEGCDGLSSNSKKDD